MSGTRTSACAYSRGPVVLAAACGVTLAMLAASVASQQATGTAAPSAASDGHVLTLRQAIRQALQRNPNRLRASHQVTAVGYERDAAEWARYPTLSVDAAPRFASTQSANVATPSTVVRLEQPLWAGGRIDAQIDAARLLVSAAESAEAETRQRLTEQTAAAYIGWMGAADRVRIAREGAEVFSTLLEYVRKRQAEGLASAADVAIASARYGAARAQTSELRGALERARAELVSLTLNPAFSEGVAVGVPAYAGRGIEETRLAYLEQSPLVAQRRHESESAAAQVQVRKGLLQPRLALRLEHLSGQNAAFGASSDSRAMLVLQYTPEPGLASYSGFQAAGSRREAARAQQLADENEVQLRANTHWAEYTAARLEAEDAEPQVAALDVASASFMRQFQAGRKSWLEVLNTQRETLDATLALSRARTARDQAALRMMVNTASVQPWLDGLPK